MEDGRLRLTNTTTVQKLKPVIFPKIIDILYVYCIVLSPLMQFYATAYQKSGEYRMSHICDGKKSQNAHLAIAVIVCFNCHR